MKESDYLSHFVTPDGLRPTSHYVQAVVEFAVTANLRELRQFLDLVSYYGRFISGFAKIAHPLHKLTCKDTLFPWAPECQRSLIRAEGETH